MAYQTINPATGQVLKEFPTISDEDLKQELTTARFATDWSNVVAI